MELLDILDKNGNVTGKVADRKTVHEQGLWHAHVGVWLMNKKGELLFQKRAATKSSLPNKWSRTGGHMDSGETPEQAVQRETEEEIGVKIPIENLELLTVGKQEKRAKEDETKMIRNFDYAYFSVVDYKLSDYTLQEEEVSDVKYVSIEDVIKARDNNDDSYAFTTWSRESFNKIIDSLQKKKEELGL